jgi:hypothetical protein
MVTAVRISNRKSRLGSRLTQSEYIGLHWMMCLGRRIAFSDRIVAKVGSDLDAVSLDSRTHKTETYELFCTKFL